MSPKPTVSKKALAERVDWERIELQYRAGVKTLREIAAEHGITHGAITKRANRDGWTRDLRARVMSKADELVSKRLVSSQVAKGRLVSKKKLDTELSAIDAAANEIATVRIGRKARVVRQQALAEKMRVELESLTDHADLFENLGEVMYAPNDKGQDKRNELYRAVIEFPNRVKALKDLTDVDAKLFGMEADAFGLAGPDPMNGGNHGPKPDAAADPQAYYVWLAAQRPTQ